MAESFSPSGIHHGDVQVWEIDIDTEAEIAPVRQRVRVVWSSVCHSKDNLILNRSK
jgi:hypothetical protein